GLRNRISTLSGELDARDAQITHLSRDVEAIPRALGARDRIIRKLDSEAAAAVERLKRETDRYHEETTRRRRLEAVLSWAQSQVAALSDREASRRTKPLGGLRTTSRALGMALTSAGGPGAITRILRTAVTPNRLRDLLVIESSGRFDEAFYL